jgi:hypothetical protein
MIKNIIIGVGLYIGIDYLLQKYKIEGRYYFNHVICNSIVVYSTFNSMLNSYDTNNIITNEELLYLYYTKITIYSLHIYHTIWYFNKLRKDDWLHHILMIGLVLPLTDCVPQNNIISHGLFYTTGLPGLIDYSLLFLNRNNIIPRYFEKKINVFLNLWIRAPGCIMNFALTIAKIINNTQLLTNYQIYYSLLISSLVYWNGIYFMNQTLADYYINRI